MHLHLIANNTRFLVLWRTWRRGRWGAPLSADWAALHGHPLELAETFVDPSRFRGTCYDASNWVRVGRTKGFARHNGGYTDPHDCPKEMFVRPLRPRWRTRRTVRNAGALHEDRGGARGQGRKHRLHGAVGVRAGAAGRAVRPGGEERFARNLQEELRALGAWRSAEGRWVAPSDSTVCRVMADTDPDALQDVLRRGRRRVCGTRLAADGKRIRGANRNADGDFRSPIARNRRKAKPGVPVPTPSRSSPPSICAATPTRPPRATAASRRAASPPATCCRERSPPSPGPVRRSASSASAPTRRPARHPSRPPTASPR